VSASLGVTASANAFFNVGDAALRVLKRRFTSAAILYAGLRALVRQRGLGAVLHSEGTSRRVTFANLSVQKSPHLAGGLTYDTPADPANGLVAVNLLEEHGLMARLRALERLQRGRFLGQPGAHHWSTSRLEIALEAPAPLELDGEIVHACQARFEVLPRRIRVCA
jgi:diacylglycerol kinase family enzyme